MAQTNELHISKDLSLPLELAARTQCIFAQKGAGKTYAAGVMCEEMLGAGAQVCVLDPTGVWWGLQSSAGGGKSPYEIIVMGGGHADVPLEPDAGEIVANFLVETGQSVVLDVSQFESQAAQDRFALALATKLYRLKAHDKANIHVFLDEADQFCPMKPQKGQEKLLHAWDLIVRLGRSRGLGLTAISQRPAVVHTNIRNNVDLLTCLRVTGPHDFKALKDWTGIHATKEQAAEFLESVPTLADGEAWFWSPSWLKIFQRAKVRKKHTFDSSRTPKPGETAAEPKARRAPDLTKLTEQIKASVQRAKATDPKHLQQRVRELEQQVAAKTADAERAAARAKPATKEVVKRIEVPVLKDGQVQRLEQLGKKLAGLLEKQDARIDAAKKVLEPVWQETVKTRDELEKQLRLVLEAVKGPVAPPAAAPIEMRINTRDEHGKKQPLDPRTAVALAEVGRKIHERLSAPAAPADPDAKVGGGGVRRVLIALAQNPGGIDDSELGLLADLAVGGSTMRDVLSKARRSGWLEGSRTDLRITPAGLAALGDYEPLPEGEDLRRYWQQKLGESGPRRLFDAFLLAWPESRTKEQLSAAAGISLDGSTMRDALSKLRRLRLIDKDKLKANDRLFRDVAGTEAA